MHIFFDAPCRKRSERSEKVRIEQQHMLIDENTLITTPAVRTTCQLVISACQDIQIDFCSQSFPCCADGGKKLLQAPGRAKHSIHEVLISTQKQ